VSIPVFAALAALLILLMGMCLAMYVWQKKRFDQQFQQARQDWSQTLSQHTQLMNQQLNSLNQNLSSALSDTRQSVQTDLKSSGALLSNIHTQLGELSEVSKRIFDVGENISTLQELLRAPKFRGGMGEYFLEDLLSQILPQSFYKTQHMFKNGQIVDAVIQIGSNKICIDSKFPLESFKLYQSAHDEAEGKRSKREFIRGVKKHIHDISTKYILPAEDTFDFALMYIPAENIYYETIIRSKDDDSAMPLFEYSLEKHIIPVSPNSIYAYLQVILLGLRGFQIESKTRDVLSKLSGLRVDVTRFENEFAVMGRHITNTSKSFDKAKGRLNQLNSNLVEIDFQGDNEDPAKLEMQSK